MSGHFDSYLLRPQSSSARHPISRSQLPESLHLRCRLAQMQMSDIFLDHLNEPVLLVLRPAEQMALTSVPWLPNDVRETVLEDWSTNLDGGIHSWLRMVGCYDVNLQLLAQHNADSILRCTYMELV